MVELQPSKLITWVRFPSPAPFFACRGGETGRRRGLKIPRLVTTIPVRFRSSAPSDFHIAKNSTCGRGGMADALASGASDGNIVEVQVLSTAPYHLNFISQHAVVAELADALSSGGSGFIRESSNLSNRTSHSLRSHLRMRFFCEEYFSSLMI